MLTAAPLSIAILGEVLLVAGQKDFSLTPPPKGFEYIKYPDSFRANLVLLSNEGYNAFLQAHTNMDQIRLTTGIEIFLIFTVGKRNYFTGYEILLDELPVVDVLFTQSNNNEGTMKFMC